MRQSEIHFIRSLGYTTLHPDHRLYVALMFQPRLIAGVLVLGLVFQSAWLFLVLSAVLWLGAAVPARNLFDAVYNRFVACPGHLPRLGVAPAPRRFAQATAATVALIVGVALLSGATLTAWIFEGLFAIGSMMVVFRRICGPAILFLRLTGTADQVPSLPRRA
ncbi:MAG TPA: DUF4395 family protein [Vicinamibacterales bacterium]|nr:DUF4395 family protein [Vicinamibacterales bacterium]